MLANPEAKVARLREIPLLQLVLLDLQSSFQDFFGLGPTDSDVHSNLLIAAYAERSNCVASFAWEGKEYELAKYCCLAAQTEFACS